MANSSPLLAHLAGDAGYERFTDEDWSLLFAEGRCAGVLNRLSYSLLDSPVASQIMPSRFQEHSRAALLQAEAFERDVQRELVHIAESLRNLGCPVVLLKGASYVLRQLPAARGRRFTDIDFLVPRSCIPSAESALMLGGWIPGKLDPYDQRYYRDWSHEIPPMTHMHRGTTIDLHHALVMPTCRIPIDSEKMIGDAGPVPGEGFWWCLKNEDALLHAAAHLILNSEFERGLRDLWDIELLFRHFSTIEQKFPANLLERAREVGLEPILRQSLYLVKCIFGTAIPDSLLPERKTWLAEVFSRAVTTRHPDTRPTGQRLADALLMLREIYLRLPNHLLARHLMHKASALIEKYDAKRVATI